MTTDKKNINRKKVAKLVRQLLIELGENPDREGLAGTPNRIADMYEEIFGGYRMDAQLDVSFSEETEVSLQRTYSSTACASIICCHSLERYMLPIFHPARYLVYRNWYGWLKSILAGFRYKSGLQSK